MREFFIEEIAKGLLQSGIAAKAAPLFASLVLAVVCCYRAVRVRGFEGWCYRAAAVAGITACITLAGTALLSWLGFQLPRYSVYAVQIGLVLATVALAVLQMRRFIGWLHEPWMPYTGSTVTMDQLQTGNPIATSSIVIQNTMGAGLKVSQVKARR